MWHSTSCTAVQQAGALVQWLTLMVARLFMCAANSSLCTTCPANLTTSRDGQAACTAPLTPGIYQAPRQAIRPTGAAPCFGSDADCVLVSQGLPFLHSSVAAAAFWRDQPCFPPVCLSPCRYAVVVDFYVVLTGLDLEDVVVRVSNPRVCCTKCGGAVASYKLLCEAGQHLNHMNS